MKSRIEAMARTEDGSVKFNLLERTKELVPAASRGTLKMYGRHLNTDGEGCEWLLSVM